MESTPEIIERLANIKQNLALKYPIASMAIFGSYARGEQTETSDLDIIVEFKDRIGIGFIDMANELENLLGLKVDLVSRGGIKERQYELIKSELQYIS